MRDLYEARALLNAIYPPVVFVTFDCAQAGREACKIDSTQRSVDASACLIPDLDEKTIFRQAFEIRLVLQDCFSGADVRWKRFGDRAKLEIK
ncbi:hypothetical protein CBA19CS91_13110 [Paraburkholderia hospita]|nr:hypothetical protein CBA19CS91_13110 [Paraburkholderia hospita]